MSLFTVIPQGPFESNGRKQLSLSSCGWVLIRSGQFKITPFLPVSPAWCLSSDWKLSVRVVHGSLSTVGFVVVVVHCRGIRLLFWGFVLVGW